MKSLYRTKNKLGLYMNKRPYIGEFSDIVNLGQEIYYTNFDYRVEQRDDLLPSEKIYKNKIYNIGHFVVNDKYGFTKDIYLFAYDEFSGIKNIPYSDRKGGGLFSEH